jgi:hypothetical protein
MTNVSFVTIPTAPISQIFNNYNPASYGGDGRHKGIDYAIMAGNPVYACMDGTVKATILSQSGYGRHIQILHADGSVSYYAHLTKTLVSVGQIVKAGQEIGKSGGDPGDGVDGDGFSTGPHLHWEIRPPGQHGTDQNAVDPMEWCIKYIPDIQREAEVTAYLGLRVRSSPSTIYGTVLYSFPHRTKIRVVEEKDGWSRVLSIRSEWCSSEYLNFTGKIITPDIDDTPVEKVYSYEEKVDLMWKEFIKLHPEI